MKIIKDIQTVGAYKDIDRNEFDKDLGKVVDRMQQQGLEVEIQFKACEKGNICYSALVIGRVESN